MEAQAAENKYLESQGVAGSSPSVPPLPVQPPYSTVSAPHSPPPALPPSQCYQPGTYPSQPPADVDITHGPKKLVEAYVLGFSLGFFGAHHFYLRRYGFGFLYLFTFGLLGAGYVLDLCRMPVLVRQANKRIMRPDVPQEKLLHEAYVLWFPMGLFGFHHFYLGRVMWGIVYLCTCGMFGIGWLIDGFRMGRLVRNVNQKNKDVREHKTPMFRHLCDVLVVSLNPITGLLGVQHYYLHRVGFGFFYTFTLGALGFGWLMDLFRMPLLVKDVNRQKMEGHDGRKRLDDCYVLAFPLGFLGLHHFYLNRPCWGVIYLCTFGCLGIGWLIDLFRLPCLVREYNAKQAVRLSPTTHGSGNNIITTTVVPGTTVVITNYQGSYPTQTLPSAPPQGPGYVEGVAPSNAYPQQQMMPYPPPPPPQGYPHPPPQYQPSTNYGAAGETSWSTINSSDFGDQPPSYEASASHVNPELQNESNQRREAPSVPPADVKY